MERDFVLRSARFIATDCLQRFLREGDIAVDATMGNGHDTCMLCRLVGENGHVYAFDVQQLAVENTRKALADENLLDRACLFCLGHEHMTDVVPSPVQAVMFNLGWLPGADKEIRTNWSTTKIAVEAALNLIEINGICVICVYPGHEQGEVERQNLTETLANLRPQDFNVLHHRFINAGPGAPECFILQKQPGCEKNVMLSSKNT